MRVKLLLSISLYCISSSAHGVWELSPIDVFPQCESVEHAPTDAEVFLLSNLADDARTVASAGLTFDRTLVAKCISEREQLEDSTERWSEVFYFFGIFPDSLRTTVSREFLAVTCRLHRQYRTGEKVKEAADCRERLERYLFLPDFNQPIEMDKRISAEEALKFLTYLAEYEFRIVPGKGQQPDIAGVNYVGRSKMKDPPVSSGREFFRAISVRSSFQAFFERTPDIVFDEITIEKGGLH